MRFPRLRRKKADKKAEALAAGTVAPEAVFVAGDGTGDGGEPGEVGAAEATGMTAAVNGTAGTGPAPATAPVPAVGTASAGAGAPSGGDPLPPPAPKLRFGFDTGEHALPPPSAAPAGVAQHTAAATGRTVSYTHLTLPTILRV